MKIIPSRGAIARVITRDADVGSGAKPQQCRSTQAHAFSYTMEKLND
jgi:hypothetical protein